MIVADILKSSVATTNFGLPSDEAELDDAMRSLATILCEDSDTYNDETVQQCRENQYVKALAAFLDHRMCVPRDMGTLSAASIKRLASSL
eukprot:15354969-Ditylum_brightwellii.AAC.1